MLNRQIIFEYYPNSDAARGGALKLIKAPLDNVGGYRVLVEFDYQQITLGHDFGATVSTVEGVPANGITSVLKTVYYPQTGTGYVFEDFSPYGMARKISLRRGMTGLTGLGQVTSYTQYTFNDGPADEPNNAPRILTRKEWSWGMTDAAGTAVPDTSPATYTYSRSTDTDGNQMDTVAYPAGSGIELVTKTYNSTNAASGAALGKEQSVTIRATGGGTIYSRVTQGYDTSGGVQIATREERDSGGNVKKFGYTHDTSGALLSVKEYGYTTGTVQRETTYEYERRQAYIDANMRHLVTKVQVWDGPESAGVQIARTSYTYDGTTPPAFSPVPPNHDMSVSNPRGNLTSMTEVHAFSPVQSYTYAYTYDASGRVTQADVSCCKKKQWKYDYAENYYAAPKYVIDGQDTVVPFLKTSIEYDFYTGLVDTTTDPQNQLTDLTYDAAWRLTRATFSTGAYTETLYGDSDLTLTQRTVYTDDGSKTITSKQWLNGQGQALRAGEGAGAEPASFDAVQMIYDQRGRLARSSHPYAGDSSGSPGTETTVTFPQLCARGPLLH